LATALLKFSSGDPLGDDMEGAQVQKKYAHLLIPFETALRLGQGCLGGVPCRQSETLCPAVWSPPFHRYSCDSCILESPGDNFLNFYISIRVGDRVRAPSAAGAQY